MQEWIELNRAIFHDELGDEYYPVLFQNDIITGITSARMLLKPT